MRKTALVKKLSITGEVIRGDPEQARSHETEALSALLATALQRL